MSKLNKIITNQPIVLTEEEVNNLSETLSAVRTAGGGEGGHLYTGDNKYIGVDNGNYKIKFLDNAIEKLESISSKLDKTEAANTYLTSADAQTLYQTKEAMSAYAKKTEIPDSITDFADTSAVIYSYLDPLTGDIQQQINGKQNKLQFDLNAKGEISAIGTLNNTTALAGANGITGDYYSASNPSGFINSAQAETQILEKHYLTETSGNSLYVPIPEGLSDGQYYAMTTSSWKVIQGAGDVSGISTVAHDDTLTGNGNNENLGVDITKIQTKLTDAQIQNITDVTTLKTASASWDKVSDKIDTTAAAQTYQPKGDYLSSNALEGYATTALLDTISSKIENDIPTKVSDLTDSATFALKTDLNDLVSSAGITTTETDYVMTTTGWKVLTLPGGGMTQVIHDTTLTGQGNANDSKLGVAWSALSGNTIDSAKSAGSANLAAQYLDSNNIAINFSTEFAYLEGVAEKVDEVYLTPDAPVWRSEPIYADYALSAYIGENNVSGFNHIVNAINAKLDTTAAAQTYLTTATYQTDSATFLTKSSADIDYAPKSVTATVNTLTAASAGWNAKIDATTLMSYLSQYVEIDYLKNPGLGLSGGYSDENGYEVGLTTTAYNAITSVSNKLDTSALTINTANNEIALATASNASAKLSAVNYKANLNSALLVPQRLVVITGDNELYNHLADYTESTFGTIFFVTSAH